LEKDYNIIAEILIKIGIYPENWVIGNSRSGLVNITCNIIDEIFKSKKCNESISDVSYEFSDKIHKKR